MSRRPSAFWRRITSRLRRPSASAGESPAAPGFDVPSWYPSEILVIFMRPIKFNVLEPNVIHSQANRAATAIREMISGQPVRIIYLDSYSGDHSNTAAALAARLDLSDAIQVWNAGSFTVPLQLYIDFFYGEILGPVVCVIDEITLRNFLIQAGCFEQVLQIYAPEKAGIELPAHLPMPFRLWFDRMKGTCGLEPLPLT